LILLKWLGGKPKFAEVVINNDNLKIVIDRTKTTIDDRILRNLLVQIGNENYPPEDQKPKVFTIFINYIKILTEAELAKLETSNNSSSMSINSSTIGSEASSSTEQRDA
jgi:hypothetical protein